MYEHYQKFFIRFAKDLVVSLGLLYKRRCYSDMGIPVFWASLASVAGVSKGREREF